MSLNKQEYREFVQLAVKCHDPSGNIRKDCDQKELDRYEALFAKAHPEPEGPQPCPIKVKGYEQSGLLKQMVSEGAEFQGILLFNQGTEARPRILIQEWLYTKPKGNPDRRAAFIRYELGSSENPRYIEAGRTIAASAYARFQK